MPADSGIPTHGGKDRRTAAAYAGEEVLGRLEGATGAWPLCHLPISGYWAFLAEPAAFFDHRILAWLISVY